MYDLLDAVAHLERPVGAHGGLAGEQVANGHLQRLELLVLRVRVVEARPLVRNEDHLVRLTRIVHLDEPAVGEEVLVLARLWVWELDSGKGYETFVQQAPPRPRPCLNLVHAANIPGADATS